jgi:hypothetical protein
MPRLDCRSAVFIVVLALGCRTSQQNLDIDTDDAAVGEADGPVMQPAECADSTAQKANGSACTCNQECKSSQCVAGICCDKACDGVCQACNVEAHAGTCWPLPPGDAPRVAGGCKTEAKTTCGFDGKCDGAGACRKYPDGTTCAEGRCSGNAVTGATICMGGHCTPGAATNCAPYACDPARNSCRTSCKDASDCDGHDCVAGSCGKRPLGATCSTAGDCGSGFCTDGVCCNLACTGACVSCNQPGRMGECAPVANGMLDTACVPEPAETCRQSGYCNGQGGCAKYPVNTVCVPAHCSVASLTTASVCNGAGDCVAGVVLSCAPFNCANGDCKGTCTSNSDCTGGNTCINNSCGKKQNGQTCKGDAECKSNNCVDGVCCDTTCKGDCVFCALPNARGRCTAVPANAPDPRNKCVDMQAASCGTNGRCNGNRACATYPTGTICKAGSCDVKNNRAIQSSVCRSGVCTDPSPGSCAPYRCNGAGCGNSCATSADCIAGVSCFNGSCGGVPVGSLCSHTADCAPGLFCAQGVCCQSACTASCYSCDQVGMKGTCAPVAAGGQDPSSTCKDTGPSTCGNDGTCNGKGGCRKYASGTTCAPARCTDGQQTATSMCNGNGQCQAGTTRACAPYACNTSDCYGSCTENKQCAAGQICDATGHCGKKKDGAMCDDGSECDSTFCIEGLCCHTDCRSLCKSCALPDSPGTCANVPAGGIDPTGGCAASPEASCGNDGTCNGGGACRKWASTTMCRAASCPADAATLTKAAFCDGQGACPAGDTQPCKPYMCDAGTNACRDTCVDRKDCSIGTCMGGTCGKKEPGASCAMGSECDSGHCVDKTCCKSNACGTCQTCASADGTCADVEDGMPDPDTCSASADACGTTGLCNGQGMCRLADAGTPCGQVCVDNDSAVAARTCDGSGQCGDPAADHTPCTGGQICTAGQCVDPAPPSAP